MKRREIIFFAQTLENSRVLIYLIFNEIQTSFSPCLKLSNDLMELWGLEKDAKDDLIVELDYNLFILLTKK